ncbi:unnamed protein product [Caenorhabditis angaria]|uniref:26S proteasome non-ATPase regulatory subunit 13 n=1 Tax=Caenorhabditis angaria TaxID=860376 RepID=A0A9P1IFS5_9PELO|nr:unnamed protein product [Caenorhabditis angaria]
MWKLFLVLVGSTVAACLNTNVQDLPRWKSEPPLPEINFEPLPENPVNGCILRCKDHHMREMDNEWSDDFTLPLFNFLKKTGNETAAFIKLQEICRSNKVMEECLRNCNQSQEASIIMAAIRSWHNSCMNLEEIREQFPCWKENGERLSGGCHLQNIRLQHDMQLFAQNQSQQNVENICLDMEQFGNCFSQEHGKYCGYRSQIIIDNLNAVNKETLLKMIKIKWNNIPPAYMVAEKVEVYLTTKQNAAKGAIADDWKNLHDNYVKKLWHQLTILTKTLVNKPAFTANLNLEEFYDNFISEFELRINALRLVEIAIPIAKYIHNKDKKKGIEFLQKIQKVVAKDRIAVARLHTGEIELRLSHKGKNDQIVDLKAIRDQIDSTQKEVDTLIGVTEVHAPFYKVSSLYLREVGDFAGYYREALRYLGVEDVNKLSKEEKQIQAVLIGFAALLGQNVHNFGELLAHPILKSLDGTGEKWLVDVLLAFNSGDLPKFYSLESQWGGWDDLKKQKDFLIAKIRLMAVMDIALARPSKGRNINFKEIAEKCQIPVDEVEFLVMKALSKDLIRGDINQVEQLVRVTWVQPRVLDNSQILQMSARIAEWRKDVSSMENIVSSQAREILTQN